MTYFMKCATTQIDNISNQSSLKYLECENGYTRYGASCYKSETDSSLADAVRVCRTNGNILWAPRRQGDEVAIPEIFGLVVLYIII